MYVEGGEEEGGETRGYCSMILTCMQGNEIGLEGAVALARALEHSSSITSLGLKVCMGGGAEGCVKAHLHAGKRNRGRRSGEVGEGPRAE